MASVAILILEASAIGLLVVGIHMVFETTRDEAWNAHQRAQKRHAKEERSNRSLLGCLFGACGVMLLAIAVLVF